jgi:hypothetical protein
MSRRAVLGLNIPCFASSSELSLPSVLHSVQEALEDTTQRYATSSAISPHLTPRSRAWTNFAVIPTSWAGCRACVRKSRHWRP